MKSPPTGPPSIRQPDKCARLTHTGRCQHVIETAFQLFAQKGFHGTRTKEIAEAAGINEALIFRDFQSKEKLYCAILDYALTRIHVDQWIQELGPYAEQRNDEKVFSTIALRLFEGYGRDQTLFRLMLFCALEHHELARRFRERQSEPVERFVSQYLRSRQEEGAFRNADPLALARSFLSMCHHHALRQVLFGGGADLPADAPAAQTFTEVFLKGVRSH